MLARSRATVLITTVMVSIATAAQAGATNYHRLLPTPGVCRADGSTDSSRSVRDRAVTCLVNRVRRRVGRDRLETAGRLEDGARRKVSDVIRCGSDLDHTPCGQALNHSYRRAGYGRSAAENLARTPAGYYSPRDVVNQWLNSRPHRQFMLERGQWRRAWNGEGHEHVAVRSKPSGEWVTWALAFGRSETPGRTDGPY